MWWWLVNVLGCVLGLFPFDCHVYVQTSPHIQTKNRNTISALVNALFPCCVVLSGVWSLRSWWNKRRSQGKLPLQRFLFLRSMSISLYFSTFSFFTSYSMTLLRLKHLATNPILFISDSVLICWDVFLHYTAYINTCNFILFQTLVETSGYASLRYNFPIKHIYIHQYKFQIPVIQRG